MSRWSGFKAGHRISIRALFLIQNLGKKQKLGVGGFSVREVLVLCCHPVCRVGQGLWVSPALPLVETGSFYPPLVREGMAWC